MAEHGLSAVRSDEYEVKLGAQERLTVRGVSGRRQSVEREDGISSRGEFAPLDSTWQTGYNQQYSVHSDTKEISDEAGQDDESG